MSKMNEEKGFVRLGFAVIAWIVFGAALYGVINWFELGKIQKQLRSKDIIIESYKDHERLLQGKIRDLKFQLRWERLLKTLLTKDRQIEFDAIEKHLQKEIPPGMIRVDMSDLEEIGNEEKQIGKTHFRNR